MEANGDCVLEGTADKTWRRTRRLSRVWEGKRKIASWARGKGIPGRRNSTSKGPGEEGAENGRTLGLKGA